MMVKIKYCFLVIYVSSFFGIANAYDNNAEIVIKDYRHMVSTNYYMDKTVVANKIDLFLGSTTNRLDIIMILGVPKKISIQNKQVLYQDIQYIIDYLNNKKLTYSFKINGKLVDDLDFYNIDIYVK